MTALDTATREQVEQLLRAGHSDIGIQRQTGIDRGTVARYRKRMGMPGYRVTADSPACRHGHPFPENIGHQPNGWLYCLTCSRTRGRNKAYRPVQPDAAAIERAVAGDPPDRLTPRERAAAIGQLDNWGRSAPVIAERAHCSRRTVHRARSKRKAAA